MTSDKFSTIGGVFHSAGGVIDGNLDVNGVVAINGVPVSTTPAAASVVANDSNVAGAKVSDALNTLKTSAGIANSSGQGGTQLQSQAATVTDAFDVLRQWSGEYSQRGGWSSISNNAAPCQLGIINTAASLNVARVPSATNWLSRRPRIGLVTAGSVGSVGFIRSGGSVFMSGTDGYRSVGRVGITSLTTNTRWGMGISPPISSNVDPASVLDSVMIGASVASGNLQLYRNDGSGTATVIDLGTNFPLVLNAAYELEVYVPPGGATVYVRVRRLDSQPFVYVNSFTTKIPVASDTIGFNFYVTNNTDNAVASIEAIDCQISIPF